MQHPDEGTIHAWLDGALDEHEAAQVAAHVASCSACEARVVEARGLIAGASRVLSALDVVPGGVIPAESAGSTAAPAHDEEHEAPARPTRHWWRRRGITPALAAAAAVAFVAAGSMLVLRQSEPRMVLERADQVAMARRPAASPSVPPSTQPAPGATSGEVGGERVAAPTVPAVAMAPVAADTTRVTPSRAVPAAKATTSVAATDRAAAGESGIRREATTRSADSIARALRAEPANEQVPRILAERAPSQIQRKAATELPNVAPTSIAGAGAAAAAAAGTMEAKAAARTRQAAAPEPTARADAAMEQRAPAATAPPVPRPSLVGSFAGCYRLTGDDPGGERMPRVFVLDTTPVAATGDSAQTRVFALAPTYVVRDTSRRASGRWSVLGATARVRWDDLPMVLELRAGTATRFDGVVRQDDRAWTVTLERCVGR